MYGDLYILCGFLYCIFPEALHFDAKKKTWGRDVLLSSEGSTAMVRDRTDFNRLSEIDMVMMSVGWGITKLS